MLKIYENSSNLSVILTITLVYLIFISSSLIRWYQKKNCTSIDYTTLAKCFIVLLLLLAWRKALDWLISIAWWITYIDHVPWSIPGALGVMNRSCLMVVVMPTESSFTVRCRHWASRQFFFLIKVGSHCSSIPDPPTLAASCISYRPWYLVIEFWCVMCLIALDRIRYLW